MRTSDLRALLNQQMRETTARPARYARVKWDLAHVTPVPHQSWAYDEIHGYRMRLVPEIRRFRKI
jgi:hypothetical protein